MRSHDYEGQIAALVEHIGALRKLVEPGNGEFHLRTLLAIKGWAYDHQPYHVGDRVQIARWVNFDKAPGYRPYAEHLEVGSVGTVEDIGYNLHSGRWSASVRIDSYPDGLFAFGWDSLAPAPAPTDTVPNGCEKCGSGATFVPDSNGS